MTAIKSSNNINWSMLEMKQMNAIAETRIVLYCTSNKRNSRKNVIKYVNINTAI